MADALSRSRQPQQNQQERLGSGKSGPHLPSSDPIPIKHQHQRQHQQSSPQSHTRLDRRHSSSDLSSGKESADSVKTIDGLTSIPPNISSPATSPSPSIEEEKALDTSSIKPSPLRRFSAWFTNHRPHPFHHHLNQLPPLSTDILSPSLTRRGSLPCGLQRENRIRKDNKRHAQHTILTHSSPLSLSSHADKATSNRNTAKAKKPRLEFENVQNAAVVSEVPTSIHSDPSESNNFASINKVGSGESRSESKQAPLPALIAQDKAEIATTPCDITLDVNSDARLDTSSRSLPHVELPLSLPDNHTNNGRSVVGRMSGVRKIWVKRPGGSATLVTIREDDLVDDARDTILRKYANSLGKSFDAPDMMLRLAQRTENTGPRPERILGPEEEMCKMLDKHYPGGQTVDEALIVDVPPRRTPKPSPKVYHHHTNYHAVEDYRPHENGTDYFPPMPAFVPQTIPQTAGSHDSRTSQHHVIAGQNSDHPRAMSVLTTGAVPPLPSPGGRRRHLENRPRFNRNHTSSPSIITHPNPTSLTTNPITANAMHPSNRHRVDSSASETLLVPNAAVAPAPLPTPPVPDAMSAKNGSTPPTPSGLHVQGPHQQRRPRKPRRSTPDRPTARSSHKHSGSGASGYNLAASIIDGSVPPINVLIVEDNVINLRILEGLMKRLKVRWQTAVNGQIGVDKWRTGGFHLVLMDIQMPVMNGLQATKEIRRLERVNGIGVFSMSNDEDTDDVAVEKSGTESDKERDMEKDKLQKTDGLFKSPVIIVALTASSLESDRREALAAGCNDFLTKPVDFVWLERKVKEWGCMQALIDFDGWRKWKDFSAKEEAGKTEEQRKEERAREEKQRIRTEEKVAREQERQRLKKEEEERKRREMAAKAGLVSQSDLHASPTTSGTAEVSA